jgi:HlyD family secretion protein
MTSPAPRRAGRAPLPRPAIYALAVLALVLAGFAACKLRPEAPKDPFRMASVERGDLTRSVSASGTLQALVTVQVGSQVSGLIKEVLVDFNSKVTKGQVLAVIDPATFATKVTQAQADLSASAATLNQQRAALKQAEAQAAVDLASYNRTKFLADKGIEAPQALDTARAQYQRSLAGVQAARAAITSQAARVGQSRAALQSNQVDLSRTRIFSPIDGVVVQRAIDPGQTVAASFQAPVLFQIAQDLSKLQVKIMVDEADIGQVQEGQQVRFTVDAFPDQTFNGAVTQVRKQPETQSNVVAYAVIAEANNPRGQLLPGMTANADILIERRTGVLKVPVAAVRFKPADQRQAATGRFPGGGFGPGFGPPGGGGQRPQGVGPRAGSSDGGGFGGDGGGGRGMFSPEAQQRLWAAVGLDDAQKKKAQAIQQETRAKMMAAIGDRDAMRAAAEEGRTRFEAILKPDQKAKYAEFRTQMQSRRRGGGQAGTVYFLKDNKPVAVAVRVGASDGSYTEIQPIGGDIKEGDQVIVGGGPAPKVQARALLPGMGGAQRR